MRTLIGPIVVVALLLPASLMSAPRGEVFPLVEGELLKRCQEQMTTDCLADIAWSLAREEKRGFNLGQLAPSFARLRQWSRGDDLLARIPADDSTWRSLQPKYVAAERLAATLSAGNVWALKPIADPLILSVAASRLMGYLPRESVVASDRIGKRLNEGFWLDTLHADRITKRALVDHWERVAAQSATYLKVDLANKFLMLGETARARRVAEGIEPKATDVGRDLVELWLRLRAPDRALEVIKALDSRHLGLYKILVAKSLSEAGKAQDASAIALEAANDSLAAKDYERLVMTAELLAEMKRPEVAKQIALKADQQSQAADPFRPFNISALGEIYGLAGDLQECLWLQAKALGVEPKKGAIIAWGLVSGPVGYGSGGMFDLGPELKQNVLARSIRCGDRGALNEISNRRLARNYCDYYRRGLVKPEYIHQRPERRTDDDAPRSFLFELAAECHFEQGENVIAFSLLQRLIEEAKSSTDFDAGYSAAELACVYGPRKLCRETLDAAGKLLVRNVADRKLGAQRVVEFAAVWQSRTTER